MSGGPERATLPGSEWFAPSCGFKIENLPALPWADGDGETFRLLDSGCSAALRILSIHGLDLEAIRDEHPGISDTTIAALVCDAVDRAVDRFRTQRHTCVAGFESAELCAFVWLLATQLRNGSKPESPRFERWKKRLAERSK